MTKDQCVNHQEWQWPDGMIMDVSSGTWNESDPTNEISRWTNNKRPWIKLD